MRIAFLVVLAIVAVLASACTTTTTANTDCTALVDSNIQTAVDVWVSDQVAAEVTYGHISDWFTGDVTSMAQLFWNKASFNEDITGWDTSSVTTMLYMFMGASAFNQAIGAWDDCGCACGAGWTGDDCELEACACSNGGVPSGTSVPDGDCSCDCSGTDYSGATCAYCTAESVASGACYAFTDSNIQTAVDAWVANPGAAEATYGHISVWYTGAVTDMSNLFDAKSSFDDDIGAWDVSKVVNMYKMFNKAAMFNQDINSWDVSSVTDMFAMFACYQTTCVFDKPIGSWDVGSVTTMFSMFQHAEAFNQDIGNWDNDGTATGSSERSSVADACSCSCATGFEGSNCQTATVDCVETTAAKSTCTSKGQELVSVTTPQSGSGAACPGASVLCEAGDGLIPEDVDCVEEAACPSTCTAIGQNLVAVTTPQSGDGAACPNDSVLCEAGNGSIPCPDNYEGVDCATETPCSSASHTCENGGGVTGTTLAAGDCGCLCASGYEGESCADEAMCADAHTCANGAITGTTVASGDCGCDCSGTGFDGSTCADKVACTCENGGAASGFIVDGDCACDCTSIDYEGDTCETETTCADGHNCANGGAVTGTTVVSGDCGCNCADTNYEGDTCTLWDWTFPCEAEQTLDAQNACNDAPADCETCETCEACEEWVSPCATGQLLDSYEVCVDVCEPVTGGRRRTNAASGCVEVGDCDEGEDEGVAAEGDWGEDAIIGAAPGAAIGALVGIVGAIAVINVA
ncbi:hypothetical protein TeGR_g681 [Tetraparma gracilis]|uniref:EGF-like domain-containing protein n=1 Tax=Tetraparma gracilis TaxID=2962635 RepID=A0ABQ6ME07_9STRA|nr:hypothetical protein TeGR_g681 [Tetraparma gracilis]